jgi:hypothetical protein
MDIAEYRKRLQEELDRAASEEHRTQDASQPADAGVLRTASGARSEQEVSTSLAILLDPKADAQRRGAALEVLRLLVAKRHELIDVVLGVLGDRSAPAALRKAALDVLRASSFRASLFAPKRPDFLNVLRSLVEDPDSDLREQALELLSQEKDEFVQRRLVEGLRNPALALVAPEHAIQFLGYDIHAEHFPLLRDLVRRAPNLLAKLEAVRLLGSDPSAKGLLVELLTNKGEDAEVRTASAVALQSLVPAEFKELAKRIVLDEGESDRLREVTMSALEHLGDLASEGKSEFLDRVKQLRNLASGDLRRAASRFLKDRED